MYSIVFIVVIAIGFEFKVTFLFNIFQNLKTAENDRFEVLLLFVKISFYTKDLTFKVMFNSVWYFQISILKSVNNNISSK